ncbi:uncharacterized protein LOC142644388 [Castanea sativa]|uniref:uncharacterized protein LOC142644388 n=1 Tax=Castanea sativa TaxID=21020 RepID=UPI003F65201E
MDEKSVGAASLQEPLSWMVYVDGSANQRGSGVGLVMAFFDRSFVSAVVNEAEYEALLVGMTMVQKMEGKVLEGSSLLPYSKSLEAEMLIRTLLPHLLPLGFKVYLGSSWLKICVNLPRDDILPNEKGEADKVQRKAPHFLLSEDKRSFSGPYLLCIHPEAVEPLLEKLHERIYGSYTGPFPKASGNRKWFLVDTDYFIKWVEAEPLENIIDMDAKIVTRFGIPHTLISNNGLQFDGKAFSFIGVIQVANLYLTGPLLKAIGGRICKRKHKSMKWLLVGTNYFTKWVEAELLANIIDMDAKIVTWFGIPHTLISNNGLQFDGKAFRRYCCEMGIKNRYSTPAYPRRNRTTLSRSTGETPFSMTYGAEAIIPLETEFPMLKTSSFTLDSYDGLLKKSLDLIEKRRENVMFQLAYYQQKLKQGYDLNVRLRPLALGDLVLLKVLGTAKNLALGKLGLN